MVSQEVTVDVAGAPMPGYLARPTTPRGSPRRDRAARDIRRQYRGQTNHRPAGRSGYVGLAINYYHRTDLTSTSPIPGGAQERFQGRRRGHQRVPPRRRRRSDRLAQFPDFVEFNHIASWGFCFGGTVAFLSATLPGLSGAICFYGGSIAAPLPSGEAEALADVDRIRCPLLLAYGARTITSRLRPSSGRARR